MLTRRTSTRKAKSAASEFFRRVISGQNVDDDSPRPSVSRDSRKPSRSPGRGSKSPSIGSTGGSQSPGRGSQSPARQSQSAGRASQSPGRGSQSPGRGSQSPGRGSQSPGRGSQTPGRGSQSPARQSQSPGRGSQSPGRGSTRSPRPVETRVASHATELSKPTDCKLGSHDGTGSSRSPRSLTVEKSQKLCDDAHIPHDNAHRGRKRGRASKNPPKEDPQSIKKTNLSDDTNCDPGHPEISRVQVREKDHVSSDASNGEMAISGNIASNKRQEKKQHKHQKKLIQQAIDKEFRIPSDVEIKQEPTDVIANLAPETVEPPAEDIPRKKTRVKTAAKQRGHSGFHYEERKRKTKTPLNPTSGADGEGKQHTVKKDGKNVEAQVQRTEEEMNRSAACLGIDLSIVKIERHEICDSVTDGCCSQPSEPVSTIQEGFSTDEISGASVKDFPYPFPSECVPQREYLNIFGLIKRSEMKTGAIAASKLHREAGGKLRRVIKPRMAPQMVYKKLTLTRGCVIEGLAEVDTDELEGGSSRECSPRGSRRPRLLPKALLKNTDDMPVGSILAHKPLSLVKFGSFQENELPSEIQRRIDFREAVSIDSAGPPPVKKKREWLKPPTKKRRVHIDEDKPETVVSKPSSGVNLGKAPKATVEKAGGFVRSGGSRLYPPPPPRVDTIDGEPTRRSARQRGGARKEWWHLLRANPDEYQVDKEWEDEQQQLAVKRKRKKEHVIGKPPMGDKCKEEPLDQVDDVDEWSSSQESIPSKEIKSSKGNVLSEILGGRGEVEAKSKKIKNRFKSKFEQSKADLSQCVDPQSYSDIYDEIAEVALNERKHTPKDWALASKILREEMAKKEARNGGTVDKKTDSREKLKAKSGSKNMLLAVQPFKRLVSSEIKANLVESGCRMFGERPAKRKRKRKKTSVDSDGVDGKVTNKNIGISIVGWDGRLLSVDSLKPYLEELMEHPTNPQTSEFTENSAGKIDGEDKSLSPASLVHYRPYTQQSNECITPHMCSVCWINDHMYCKNMKRIARDLPKVGACIHYAPCSHLRRIKESYTHQTGRLIDSGLTSTFLQNSEGDGSNKSGSLAARESIGTPPRCGNDLLCSENMLESDSEPCSPPVPEGTELLKVQLRARAKQIARALGFEQVSRMGPPESSVQRRVHAGIGDGELGCGSGVEVRVAAVEEEVDKPNLGDQADVHVKEYGCQIVLSEDGLSELGLVEALDEHSTEELEMKMALLGVPADGEEKKSSHADANKLQIRLLPVKDGSLEISSLGSLGKHKLIRVKVQKLGANKILLKQSAADQLHSVDDIVRAGRDIYDDGHDTVVREIELPTTDGRSGELDPSWLSGILAEEALKIARVQRDKDKQSIGKMPTTKGTGTKSVDVKAEPETEEGSNMESEELVGEPAVEWSAEVDSNVAWSVETILSEDEDDQEDQNTARKVDEPVVSDSNSQDSLDFSSVMLDEPAVTMAMSDFIQNSKVVVGTTDNTGDLPLYVETPQVSLPEDLLPPALIHKDGSHMLSFSTKDIREKKPQLMKYLRHFGVAPLIADTLKVEKATLKEIHSEADYALSKLLEDLEQKKCLHAAVLSERDSLRDKTRSNCEKLNQIIKESGKILRDTKSLWVQEEITRKNVGRYEKALKDMQKEGLLPADPAEPVAVQNTIAEASTELQVIASIDTTTTASVDSTSSSQPVTVLASSAAAESAHQTAVLDVVKVQKQTPKQNFNYVLVPVTTGASTAGVPVFRMQSITTGTIKPIGRTGLRISPTLSAGQPSLTSCVQAGGSTSPRLSTAKLLSTIPMVKSVNPMRMNLSPVRSNSFPRASMNPMPPNVALANLATSTIGHITAMATSSSAAAIAPGVTDTTFQQAGGVTTVVKGITPTVSSGTPGGMRPMLASLTGGTGLRPVLIPVSFASGHAKGLVPVMKKVKGNFLRVASGRANTTAAKGRVSCAVEAQNENKLPSFSQDLLHLESISEAAKGRSISASLVSSVDLQPVEPLAVSDACHVTTAPPMLTKLTSISSQTLDSLPKTLAPSGCPVSSMPGLLTIDRNGKLQLHTGTMTTAISNLNTGTPFALNQQGVVGSHQNAVVSLTSSSPELAAFARTQKTAPDLMRAEPSTTTSTLQDVALIPTVTTTKSMQLSFQLPKHTSDKQASTTTVASSPTGKSVALTVDGGPVTSVLLPALPRTVQPTTLSSTVAASQHTFSLVEPESSTVLALPNETCPTGDDSGSATALFSSPEISVSQISDISLSSVGVQKSAGGAQSVAATIAKVQMAGMNPVSMTASCLGQGLGARLTASCLGQGLGARLVAGAPGQGKLLLLPIQPGSQGPLQIRTAGNVQAKVVQTLMPVRQKAAVLAKSTAANTSVNSNKSSTAVTKITPSTDNVICATSDLPRIPSVDTPNTPTKGGTSHMQGKHHSRLVVSSSIIQGNKRDYEGNPVAVKTTLCQGAKLNVQTVNLQSIASGGLVVQMPHSSVLTNIGSGSRTAAPTAILQSLEHTPANATKANIPDVDITQVYYRDILPKLNVIGKPKLLPKKSVRSKSRTQKAPASVLQVMKDCPAVRQSSDCPIMVSEKLVPQGTVAISPSTVATLDCQIPAHEQESNQSCEVIADCGPVNSPLVAVHSEMIEQFGVGGHTLSALQPQEQDEQVADLFVPEMSRQQEVYSQEIATSHVSSQQPTQSATDEQPTLHDNFFDQLLELQ